MKVKLNLKGDFMKFNILRVLFLLAGGVLIMTGINRQETLGVLTKAINICLECIGIG